MSLARQQLWLLKKVPVHPSVGTAIRLATRSLATEVHTYDQPNHKDPPPSLPHSKRRRIESSENDRSKSNNGTDGGSSSSSAGGEEVTGAPMYTSRWSPSLTFPFPNSYTSSRRSSSPPSSSSSSSSPSTTSSTTQQPPTASPEPRPPLGVSPSDQPFSRQIPRNFGSNQIISVPLEVQKELEEVVGGFQAPIRYAFAYGSGVFRQKSYGDKSSPMLDFLFAVTHPSHWHAINLRQNPSHYAFLPRHTGSGLISFIQERTGAGVWFNTGIKYGGKEIKYGVVSVDTLCKDLLDWETLYVSGRMQKPIRILRDDARVRLANQVNLASALRTSLLLLPEKFTDEQLYNGIAGLSYRGDFRMRVAENPKKVSNIVTAQLDQFRDLYGGLLRSMRKTVSVSSTDSRDISQDVHPKALADVAKKLPKNLREKVRSSYERKWNILKAQGKEVAMAAEGVDAQAAGRDESELWQRIVADDEFKTTLDNCLQSIVSRHSFTQTLKGLYTAGPSKSISYVGAKLTKRKGAAEGGGSS